MSARNLRGFLSSVHPAFTIEVLVIVAVWAGMLWCVAASEERAMQRVEVQP